MGTESSPSQCTGQGTQQQDHLVAVTFQKNPYRKQKFLEAEPKALGITQTGLCVYQITWLGVAFAIHISDTEFCVAFFILNLPGIIAGSLAIAAQNLHLPTLRACLGMQVLACLAAIINAFLSAGGMMGGHPHRICWDWAWGDMYYNETTWDQWRESEDYTTCRQVRVGYYHLHAGFILIQAALVAISCTLASYCCKVVNCCSPASKMPVITVQASPAQQ